MNCPEDANIAIYTCGALKKGAYCTRKKGHKGDHHAHTFSKYNKCVKVWKQE